MTQHAASYLFYIVAGFLVGPVAVRCWANFTAKPSILPGKESSNVTRDVLQR